MPLCHAMTDRALSHAGASLEITGAAGRPLFLFAGPSRRKHPRGVAAVAVFRAGVESSATVSTCEGSPYDTGGARRYAGMSADQALAADRELSMSGTSFRAYLACLLGCAFETPGEYLEEAPGPELEPAVDGDSLAARGLASALAKADSSCWTVEVRLRFESGGIDLEKSEHLDTFAVLGSEHEPIHARIEERLGPGRTLFIADARDRTTEDGLAESLRSADERFVVARRWSRDRVRTLLERGGAS